MEPQSYKNNPGLCFNTQAFLNYCPELSPIYPRARIASKYSRGMKRNSRFSSMFKPQEAKLDSDEEARAERKRRQRQAQEEFRLKQLMRQKTEESTSDLRNGSSIDRLLMDIPTQDIVIEESGSKRKTPPPEGQNKRRGCISKLDIVETE